MKTVFAGMRKESFICRGLLLLSLSAFLFGPGYGVIHAEEAPAEKPRDDLAALAARADKAVAAVGVSPGREYANRLRNDQYPGWFAFFKGEKKQPSWPSLNHAVADISNLVKMVEAGPQWPDPGLYSIPYASVKPAVDGNPDDPAWKNAWTWDKLYPFNSIDAAGPGTVFKMLWDEDYLYVAFDCVDPDIIAPDRERDEAVFSDDCVEIFILPDFRFRAYWEIVIAPNGCIFDATHTKDIGKWGGSADPAQDMKGLKHVQQVRGTLNMSEDTDEGYTVQMAIPFDELPGYTRSPARSGDKLYFMLIRLDRSSESFKAYAFKPLQGWGHNIWNHAVMELMPPEGN